MSSSSLSPAPSWAARLRAHALGFLALSAALPLALLEAKNDDGSHQFSRGRHKYYGIACLVIFFAIFSGYGMAHMLASMSQFSLPGAILAGVLWAGFQWCLERQILLSMALDATRWQKLWGITWRSLLALLSASTLVYPFFVESNRAEIDVRVGETARMRQIDNQASAQQAAGLPRLRQDQSRVQEQLAAVEKQLSIEPAEVTILRKRAAACWTQFQADETRWMREWRQLAALRSQANVDASALQAMTRLQKTMENAKAKCGQLDSQFNKQLNAWRLAKETEKKGLVQEASLLQKDWLEALKQEQGLRNAQSEKIERAAASGFAADFMAVADLLVEDAARRFQLLWWLTWFLAIELIALLVKLNADTDLDHYLLQQEALTKAKFAMHHQAQLREMTQQFKRQELQQAGESAYWQTHAMDAAQARLHFEMQMQGMEQADCLRLKYLQRLLQQMAEIEQVTQAAGHHAKSDQFAEQVQELAQHSLRNLIDQYQMLLQKISATKASSTI